MTLTSYEWQHIIGTDLWRSLTAEERAAALATDIEALNAASIGDAISLAQAGNPGAACYVERRLLARQRNKQDAQLNIQRAWNWRHGH